MCSASTVFREQLLSNSDNFNLEVSGRAGTFHSILSALYSGALEFRTEQERSDMSEMAAKLGMDGVVSALSGMGDLSQCVVCRADGMYDDDEYYDDYQEEPLTLRITPEMVMTEGEDEGELYREAMMKRGMLEGLGRELKVKKERAKKERVKRVKKEKNPADYVSGGGRLCFCNVCGKTLRGLTAYKRHLVQR